MIKAIMDRMRRRAAAPAIPQDIDPESARIFRSVQPYTMVGAERTFALIQAVRHVVSANVPGDIVECGVWRGGSMMAAAYALQSLGRCDRDLYLFDTYSGMTAPTEVDTNAIGESAATLMGGSVWAHASLEEVQGNLARTGYDMRRLHFIRGRVEDTLPGAAPERIAILRLDTDWYESTRHELTHLYPRLSPGGVLIIDDYGHWQGCRKAVDEYFSTSGIRILLHRVDYTGRVAVKP